MAVKISNVLHLAADEFLAHEWTDIHRSPDEGTRCTYSCGAINVACNHLEVSAHLRTNLIRGIKRMGVGVRSFTEFDDVAVGLPYAESFKRRQEARYAWLKFAAHIAEEQGC
jgi:hypothetical protein